MLPLQGSTTTRASTPMPKLHPSKGVFGSNNLEPDYSVSTSLCMYYIIVQLEQELEEEQPRRASFSAVYTPASRLFLKIISRDLLFRFVWGKIIQIIFLE